jgi:hypothetical protein
VSATNCSGTTASFSVAATGTGLGYQWYKGSGALGGQTSSSLALTNVSAGDAGAYSVVVSGLCGSPVTNSAGLIVNQAVAVSSGPVSVTNHHGTTVSFSVTATGTELAYQWHKGDVVLNGQTSSSLVLTNVGATDAGTYNVVVSGLCGSPVTNSASLVLVQEFAIESIVLSNGVVVITCSAIAGKNYKLQYTDTLDGTNWSDVPPGVVATGSKATVTDALGVTRQRFYRVMLVP